MGIVLEAKGLTKSYQSGKQKIEVLKNIDAAFENGIFYAITGRSGLGNPHFYTFFPVWKNRIQEAL